MVICNESISSEINHPFYVYYLFVFFYCIFPIYLIHFSIGLFYIFLDYFIRTLCYFVYSIFFLTGIMNIFFQTDIFLLNSFMNLFHCNKFFDIAKSVSFFYNFCTLILTYKVIPKLTLIKISYILVNAFSFLCLTLFGILFEIFQIHFKNKTKFFIFHD